MLQPDKFSEGSGSQGWGPCLAATRADRTASADELQIEIASTALLMASLSVHTSEYVACRLDPAEDLAATTLRQAGAAANP